MNQRIAKIERILKVQKQLHQAAEWRVAELERTKQQLQSAQEELIAALNEDTHLQGLFIDATAKRLQRLAGEAEQIAAACQTQRDIAIDRGMQMKRTEKLAANLKSEDRRDVEKKELASILEALVAGRQKLPAS